MIKRSALALGIIGGLVGCGGSDDAYTAFINAEQSATDAVCNCFAAFDFASEAACLEEIAATADTPTEIACANDVFAEYKDEVKPTVDCQLDAFAAAKRCLNNVNACDPDAAQACFLAASVTLEACPDLPEAVDIAFEACFP